MMHTKNIPLRIGGAVLLTYESYEEDFEKELGPELLEAGNIR